MLHFSLSGPTLLSYRLLNPFPTTLIDVSNRHHPSLHACNMPFKEKHVDVVTLSRSPHLLPVWTKKTWLITFHIIVRAAPTDPSYQHNQRETSRQLQTLQSYLYVVWEGLVHMNIVYSSLEPPMSLSGSRSQFILIPAGFPGTGGQRLACIRRVICSGIMLEAGELH